MANDGDPAEDRPPGGLSLWWPQSGWALALWLLTGVVVSAIVAAKLLLYGAIHLIDALPLGRCGCSDPPSTHSWYLSPVLRAAALCLLPIAAMAIYQMIATVYLNTASPIWKCIFWTSAAIVGGLALRWLLLGGLADLVV